MDNKNLTDGGIYCVTTWIGGRWIYKYKNNDGISSKYLTSHDGSLCVIYNNKVCMDFYHALPNGSVITGNDCVSEIRKATENEIAMFNFYKNNDYVDGRS